MKHLIITSMIALIALAGPLGTQLRADDAHHPEKSAKAKKSTATKSNQQQKKKPAAKTNKSKQSEIWRGLQARKARRAFARVPHVNASRTTPVHRAAQEPGR